MNAPRMDFCPCCGSGESVLVCAPDRLLTLLELYVQCLECGARGPCFSTKNKRARAVNACAEQALGKWNAHRSWEEIGACLFCQKKVQFTDKEVACPFSEKTGVGYRVDCCDLHGGCGAQGPIVGFRFSVSSEKMETACLEAWYGKPWKTYP